MKTTIPERLFVLQCDKFFFTLNSHSQILFNLVRVGIDVTLHELLLQLRGSIKVKSNANFPIIFDAIYNHVEFGLFICFLYPCSRMLVYQVFEKMFSNLNIYMVEYKLLLK